MVEAQHRISTLKLVDTVEEQAILEKLIETAKPPYPDDEAFVGLHYLLATPFRYPPLPHGSRFSSRFERGVWYGAEHERTVMAEVAYYRLYFLEGTTAEISHTESEHSLFRVGYATDAGVDLTSPPFAAIAEEVSSKSSYRMPQEIGGAMRAAGVEAFLWTSARDPERGRNIGLFSPRAFAARRPSSAAPPTWVCTTTRAQVVFRHRDLLRLREVVFARDAFTVEGLLPRPSP